MPKADVCGDPEFLEERATPSVPWKQPANTEATLGRGCFLEVWLLGKTIPSGAMYPTINVKVIFIKSMQEPHMSSVGPNRATKFAVALPAERSAKLLTYIGLKYQHLSGGIDDKEGGIIASVFEGSSHGVRSIDKVALSQ